MNVTRMRQIVRRPLLSEKSALKQEKGTLCFQVARDANKIEIRQAVQHLFGVKVQKVRTLNVRGKMRRFRLAVGKRPNWKKAYVILKEGEKMVSFEDFVVEEKG
jgi:large subunit ribosomal protein L23